MGKRAHGIAAKLRSRVAAGGEETKAVVLKATGALADLAETAVRDAERLLTNGQASLCAALSRGTGRPR